MRPIGYVAAAAAGLFVPVAFALPAVAATPSLSGVNSIVGSQTDGSDNGGDVDDGSGSDNEFSGNVDIFASSSEASGDVAVLVDGEDLQPFMEVELNSPGLDAACDGEEISDALLVADRLGHIDATATADNCVPGTYRISVSQQDTPFQTASAEVTID